MARTVIVRDSGLCSALLVPSRVDGCRELLPSVSFPFLRLPLGRSLLSSFLSFLLLLFPTFAPSSRDPTAERIDGLTDRRSLDRHFQIAIVIGCGNFISNFKTEFICKSTRPIFVFCSSCRRCKSFRFAKAFSVSEVPSSRNLCY